MVNIWKCRITFSQVFNPLSICSIVTSFKYWNIFKANIDFRTQIVIIIIVDENRVKEIIEVFKNDSVDPEVAFNLLIVIVSS